VRWGHLEASIVRVLVVDDYEPFRQFVRFTLSQRPDLQVIGEASDGLEAVHKAEELKPDLIVLDIGLPPLMGSKWPGESASPALHAKSFS
jgi:DNA-binding NarL/FixJ family response regulator